MPLPQVEQVQNRGDKQNDHEQQNEQIQGAAHFERPLRFALSFLPQAFEFLIQGFLNLRFITQGDRQPGGPFAVPGERQFDYFLWCR